MKFQNYLEIVSCIRNYKERAMDLTEKYLGEGTAKDRFWEFSKKYKGGDKLSKAINSRTERMKNVKKLMDWIDVLEDQNYHAEAEKALERVKALGGG